MLATTLVRSFRRFWMIESDDIPLVDAIEKGVAEVGKFDGGTSSPPHLSESQALRGCQTTGASLL